MKKRAVPLRLAFCHPDLGLGGAERLIVDAAAELVKLDHKVIIFTAHYDPNRCFKETLEGKFAIKVCGSWLPRQIAGRFHAICACLRCIFIAFYIAWFSWRTNQIFDVVIVDQVSIVNPFLHGLTKSKVLFYCHFPDMLLAQRQSWPRLFYRMPIDYLEQETTGMADTILVNSAYTQGVFAKTFKRLHARGIVPSILHPAVNVPSEAVLADTLAQWPQTLSPALAEFARAGPVFLSINRFERKKGIELAIQALGRLLDRLQKEEMAHLELPRLIVAGGYDVRLAENRLYFEELQKEAVHLKLKDKVWFLPSFTDAERGALLAICRAVVYTPQNEHFGIVPLEAMASARPVIACNSGGPLESIRDGTTGFLVEPEPDAFAAAMLKLMDPKKAQTIGQQARMHVQLCFSRSSFGIKLQQQLRSLVRSVTSKKS
eukprot:jgi/Botrbrau1/16815/Bobra.150_2s0042.1